MFQAAAAQRALDVPQSFLPSPGAESPHFQPKKTNLTVREQKAAAHLQARPWECSPQPCECNDFSQRIVFPCTSHSPEHHVLPIKG